MVKKVIQKYRMVEHAIIYHHANFEGKQKSLQGNNEEKSTLG
jgi:hypothetical protein